MKKKHPMRVIFTLALVLILSQVSVFAAPHLTSPSTTTPAAQQATGNKDIVDIAMGDSRFSTLVAALKAAGLVDTLKGEGPFTVFAPTNEAFAKLPAGTLDNLLKPENKEQLVKLLTYHVLPGKVTSKDAAALAGTQVKMLNNEKARIERQDGSLFIAGAKIIMPDIMAKNGVVHVIDTVIMP